MGTWMPLAVDGLNESAWRLISKLAQNQQATKSTVVKDLLDTQAAGLEEVKRLEQRGLVTVSISGLDVKIGKMNHPRLLDIRLTRRGMGEAMKPHALVLRVLATHRSGRLVRFVREEADATSDDLLNMGAAGFIAGFGPTGEPVPIFELRELPSALLLKITKHGLRFAPR